MQRSTLRLTAIIVLLVTLACHNSSRAKDEKKDSLVVQPPVDSAALKFVGTYSGYVPCPDCPGIETYLQLKPDKSYRLEETFSGKTGEVTVTEGNWGLEKGKVELYKGDVINVSFLPEPDKLIQLDPSGNRISGNLGDKYVLFKQEIAHNTEWEKEKKSGIDFIGLGNEPFWSLEIDREGKVSFNTPEMKTPVTFPYQPPTNKTNTTTDYKLESNGDKLDITILHQFCSDGMSEFLYNYRVKLKFKGKGYSGCGVMLSSL
jgi:uncharacterized membrane protein